MSQLNQYVNINGTATTTEQSVPVGVIKVKLMANDNTTGDLYLSLDKSFSEAGTNYFIIKPEEAFKNLEELSCSILYYKSSTGTVNFRFMGTKK